MNSRRLNVKRALSDYVAIIPILCSVVVLGISIRASAEPYDDYMAAAEEAVGNGVYQKAIRQYYWALNERPDDYKASVKLVSLLVGQNRLEEANRILAGVLSSNEHDATLWLKQGHIYRLMGQNALASEAYGMAAEAEAGDADFLSHLAEIHRRNGDLESSNALLQEAERLNRVR